MLNQLRAAVISLVLLPAVFCISHWAGAATLTVSPSAVNPGDPFVVVIHDADASSPVEARFGEQRLPLVPCGQACYMAIGSTGLETSPGEKIINVSSGPFVMKAGITVRQPSFPEIHLKLPKGKVSLSEEDLKRVRNEEKRLNALFEVRSERRWDGQFIRPLDTPVSTGFGVRRIMNKEHTSHHRGVDFKGTLGLPVRASNSGSVVLAAELFYGGNTLVLDHGSGIFTVYMHLDSFALAEGADVRKGELIGYVGSTGRSTGPHLHLSLKILGTSANPLALFDLPL